jgi:diguanylate cyclase (GGDEF)-like protein
MVLAGPASGAFGAASGFPVLDALRLIIVALTLPVVMSLLARSVTRPAEELVASHDRLQRLYDQARLDALIDPISGLGNHRAFQEEMTRQIEAARRQGHSLALVLVDLDDLKRINDEDGHAGGDEVLSAMGRLIGGASRAADRGFRIGGDEFALLLPGADAQAATGVVQRLLASALNAEAPRPGARPFSFSAGLSAYPMPAGDGQRLFHQADAALYWAKKHGRTDVQAFDPERHGAADDTRSTPELAEAVMEVALQKAVTPVYQTIFDLRTGQPVGFEGLVRPAHGSGFRDAQSLFVAAEAAQRSVELDLVCVEAVIQGARLPNAECYLAFNMSPRTLETEQFRVADLLAILTPYGIAPTRVVLEITERDAIEDMNRLRQNLERCRAAGIRIAADDVGAGNAGLRLLSEVRFDIVKIDLSLVQRGALRDSALAVLRAIRDIGQQSGAVVVAEGIETADQLEVVRTLDLVAGQGYLLGMPAPEIRAQALDLESLLAEHEHRRRAFGGFLDIRSADEWLIPMDSPDTKAGEAKNGHPTAEVPVPSPGQVPARRRDSTKSVARPTTAAPAPPADGRPRPARRKKESRSTGTDGPVRPPTLRTGAARERPPRS